MKWEYHVEELVYEHDGEQEIPASRTLNELGAEGWELVSVVDTGNAEADTGCPHFAFVFKRPLESKEPTT